MSNTENEFDARVRELEKQMPLIDEKLSNIDKKVDKILFMLNGNGKVEDGMIFRVAKIESIQRECPVQELKKQTKMIVIAGIITVAIAILKYLFDFLKILR